MKHTEYKITMCTWQDGKLSGEVQVIDSGEYITIAPFDCSKEANREQAMHDQLMIVLEERRLEKELGDVAN